MALSSTNNRVLIAHDYFAQRGGAERVASALANVLKPRTVVTAVYRASSTFAIDRDVEIVTSILQRIRPFRVDPRLAIWLLPVIWTLFPKVRDGVVICSSSGWAHGLRVSRAAKKVVYCHNIARWLYQPDDYFHGRSRFTRGLLSLIAPYLRWWDRRAAKSADIYIANSTLVARRIKQAYGIEAVVLHPPIGLSVMGEETPVDGLPNSFFLTVGRSRGYKQTENLIRGFAMRSNEHLVCVGSPDRGTSHPRNVVFLKKISDAQLRWLYSNARALISVSREDFGLTPIEANAFGTPSFCLQAGGFLDSVVPGVTGQFLKDSEPETIAAGLDTFPSRWNKSHIQAHAASFSMESFVAKLLAIVETRT